MVECVKGELWHTVLTHLLERKTVPGQLGSVW